MERISVVEFPLEKVNLFCGLEPPEINAVRRLATGYAFEEDEFLFYQGDPAERMYVVVDGNVKLTQTSPDGQQVLLRVAGPGSIFATVAVLAQAEYPLTAQAGSDCQVLTWTHAQLRPLFAQSTQIAYNALELMASQVQEFQDRYRELATERVERRLARTVLRLARQTGKKTPDGVLIDLALTRQDLAEMTGTTLFTVSRILSQWDAAGLVSSGRERVVIRSPHALVKIADDLG